MKKEQLRKVEFTIYSETEFKSHTYLGYFHKWGDFSSEVIYEDRDSECLKNTMGIVEDEETGQIHIVTPDWVKFLS